MKTFWPVDLPNCSNQGLHCWDDILCSNITVWLVLCVVFSYSLHYKKKKLSWEKPLCVQFRALYECSMCTRLCESWAIPSVEGRAFSRKEVRKRVRSLKLQLFCTLVGLVASGTFSLLGDWRTLPGGTGEEALLRSAWVERELFILMRSRNPIFPLPGNLQHCIHKQQLGFIRQVNSVCEAIIFTKKLMEWKNKCNI